MNTPETTPSGNIHGMPLAALLGYGAPELVNVGGFSPKFDQRLCAHVGARDIDALSPQRNGLEILLTDETIAMLQVPGNLLFGFRNRLGIRTAPGWNRIDDFDSGRQRRTGIDRAGADQDPRREERDFPHDRRITNLGNTRNRPRV